MLDVSGKADAPPHGRDLLASGAIDTFVTDRLIITTSGQRSPGYSMLHHRLAHSLRQLGQGAAAVVAVE